MASRASQIAACRSWSPSIFPNTNHVAKAKLKSERLRLERLGPIRHNEVEGGDVAKTCPDAKQRHFLRGSRVEIYPWLGKMEVGRTRRTLMFKKNRFPQ